MPVRCIFFASSFLLVTISTIAYSSAAAQEGIAYDPASGDYVVTYLDGYSGRLNTVIFVPATKIEPTLKSKFWLDDDTDLISYEYKVRNGSRSRQHIDALRVLLSSIEPHNLKSPKHWGANVVPELTSTGGLRLSWTYRGEEELGGLSPGSGLKGFAIKSKDLPGITMMRITGARPVIEWLGHFPAGAIGEQMDRIIETDFVPRFAAVPKIPVPEPFAAAPVLSALSQHLTQDLVSWQLVDAVFAQQLAKLLEAAAEAAVRQNLTAARAHLKQFRKLLRQVHPKLEEDDDKDDVDADKAHKTPPRASAPLIDRLAARVLDFDAKYLLQRLGGGKDD